VLTGAVPPAATGDAKATVIGNPLGDATVAAAGQVNVIAGGGDGATGSLPH
jgi:hypothetical protein